jgi:sporulation protein YlmC with PRC-barrel domain
MMMKRMLRRASLIPMLAVIGVAAHAAKQQPPAQQPEAPTSSSRPQAQPQSGVRFLTQQSGRQMLSSNLVGMPVVNQTGDPIGDVGNLVIDTSGHLVGVVVKTGGFLGLGAKRVALPLDEIRLDPGQKNAIVNLTKSDFQNAPAYATIAEQNRTPEAQPQQSPAQQRHNGTPPPPPEHTGAPANRAMPPHVNEK